MCVCVCVCVCVIVRKRFFIYCLGSWSKSCDLTTRSVIVVIIVCCA